MRGSWSYTKIAHELRKKKFGGLFLKIDLENDYDRVNWDIVE
jgi:hypothetical protein